MDTFTHLSVYVSLILAIAVSRNLIGIAQLIESRARVKWSWIFLVWGIFFILVPAAEWWYLNDWSASKDIDVFDFFWMLIRPTVLFLMCAILFSRFPSSGQIDLWEHFDSVRPWFFSLGAIYTLLSIIGEEAFLSLRADDSIHGGLVGWSRWQTIDTLNTIVIVILLGIGAAVRSKKYHMFLAPTVIALFFLLFGLGE